ncbi:hypothetical protein Vadar_012829 [Vaccinium darrowii]|uniref:Uncharacterized protein n=1 Tax=Vaccinium darrowii TaxID=229202 RepID=A0ACB7X9A2_9ERIC|nr:hypothetical protein Vadar_012829 [Vaccinium darrowii]
MVCSSPEVEVEREREREAGGAAGRGGSRIAGVHCEVLGGDDRSYSIPHFHTMKRRMPWSDGEDDSSSDDSSTLDTDTESNDGSDKKNNTKISGTGTSSKRSKEKTSGADSGKRKSKVINFEALSQHGYKGGPSILGVPPPKETDQEKDWSWSTGKESRATNETEETYEERRRTRDAIIEGEQLTNVQTQKEKKNFSFSQKEKRKRDIGQASRGKSYVEEEKRLLRDSGVYSGFDS